MLHLLAVARSFLNVLELNFMEIVNYKWRTIHICLYTAQEVDFHQ